jgi:hypothetical protein
MGERCWCITVIFYRSHQLELVLISYCVALQCEAVFFIPKHQTNHKRGEVGES